MRKKKIDLLLDFQNDFIKNNNNNVKMYLKKKIVEKLVKI